LNERDLKRYFTLARNVSKHAEYKIKVGCVILDHGTPVSVGFNKIKFDGLFSDKDYNSIHAEASAVKASGKSQIRGSIFFVYRETRNGMPALAKPCKNCMEKIIKFGAKKVYYSTNEFPYWECLEF
jgi:deoxycytidylate deaminase